MRKLNQIEELSVPNTGCAANGCRLIGSFSQGTNGMGRWYCRNHFGKERIFDEPISQGIAKNMWMLELAKKISTPELYWKGTKTVTPTKQMYQAITNALKAKNLDNLLPQKYVNKYGKVIDEGSHNSVWAHRIYQEFDANVTKGLEL